MHTVQGKINSMPACRTQTASDRNSSSLAIVGLPLKWLRHTRCGEVFRASECRLILIRKAGECSRPSNPQVATLRATVRAVLCGFALFWGFSTPLHAAAQQPAGEPPVSLDRIKEELARTRGPGLELDVAMPDPLPTFKSRVDQRRFVLTLEEALHKQFDLNDLQRQSAQWASKCCGYDVGRLFNAVEKARHERKIRKTREQIARELAELEDSRKISPAVVK